MSDYILASKYYTRTVVRQRNSGALVNWAGSVAIQAIPTSPDDPWVRQRVLAESVPLSLDMYVGQTLPYFAQDPTTQTNMLQFISEDNDDTIEVSLAAQCDSIILAFAQRWADTVINPTQVANWRTTNNAPAPGKDKPNGNQ